MHRHTSTMCGFGQVRLRGPDAAVTVRTLSVDADSRPPGRFGSPRADEQQARDLFDHPERVEMPPVQNVSQTLSISLFTSPVITFEQARQVPVEGGIHQRRKVQQSGTATQSPSPAFRCVRSPRSVLKEAWTTAMPRVRNEGGQGSEAP